MKYLTTFQYKNKNELQHGDILGTQDDLVRIIKESLHEKINSLKDDLKDDIYSTREDLKDDIKLTKENLKEDILQVGLEIKGFHDVCFRDMNSLEKKISSLSARIDALEQSNYKIIAYAGAIAFISAIGFDLIMK